MNKKLVKFAIEPELWEFAKSYGKQNSTSAAQIIRDIFIRLRRESIESGEDAENQTDSNQLNRNEARSERNATMDTLDIQPQTNFGVKKPEMGISEDVFEAQQSFIIDTVDKLIAQAINEGASDIHIRPNAIESILDYRINGTLQRRPMPNKAWHNAVVSRIKIMAGMNIAKRDVAQDARFSIKSDGKRYELRVSMLPTVFGESVSMQIIDRSDLRIPPLSELGFSAENQACFEIACEQSHGLILVVGPGVGSGKSTTLFSALNVINPQERRIVSIEYFVKYEFPHVVQIPTRFDVNPPVTFASALRASLRHDPDVIMVGEMRDAETATLGVRAALTEHLLLSTLNINDAPSAIIRLLDFGIEPFLISEAISLVIAQRLAHAICKNCRATVEPTDEEMKILEEHSIDTTHLQLSRGEGCEVCDGKGMMGRIAIHEVMEINDAIRQVILKGASSHQLKQVAMENGMKTLRQDGLAKAAQGLTTLLEIMRLTGEF